MATSAFGKAFRAARDAGEKEFTFNGAKYNTRYAEEESPKKMSMAAQGLTSKGEQAPLRNIPELSSTPEDRVSTKESLSLGEEVMKRGGKVKSSASKRADGIAQRGHTKGKMR